MSALLEALRRIESRPVPPAIFTTPIADSPWIVAVAPTPAEPAPSPPNSTTPSAYLMSRIYAEVPLEQPEMLAELEISAPNIVTVSDVLKPPGSVELPRSAATGQCEELAKAVFQHFPRGGALAIVPCAFDTRLTEWLGDLAAALSHRSGRIVDIRGPGALESASFRKSADDGILLDAVTLAAKSRSGPSSDYLLIHMPMEFATSHAAQLARLDGVLLIAYEGRSSMRAVDVVATTLRSQQVPLIGFAYFR